MKEILDILSGFKNRGIVLSLDDTGKNVKARGNVSGLSASDKVWLKERKDDIVFLLRQARQSGAAIEPLSPAADYALSSSQRRLWLLGQFEEANVAYNMPGVYIFEGTLDQKALEAAFASLIEKHESLRTIFKENAAGEARQVVMSPEASGFVLHYSDLRTDENRASLVKEMVSRDAIHPFDLSSGPLLRASLYQVEDNKWVFSHVMHHIISDGWSMNILIKELLQFYAAHANGDAPLSEPLRIQYKDYAAWQQDQLESEDLKAQKNYWLNQLEGELPVLELPGEKQRPALKTYNGDTVHVRLDAERTAALKALGQQGGGTLFMTLLAAVNALLYRYTGQEDIIIGSPVAGREAGGLEGQIGFYLNTLALRSRFSGNNNFIELLEVVKQAALDGFRNQAYPFDELVDNLDLRRDMSRSALFDVMVVLQNNDRDGGDALHQLHGLRVSNYNDTLPLASKFDLEFDFTEIGDELYLDLGYNTDIYGRDRMERLAVHLQNLLSALIREPQKPVAELEYLTGEEKTQILRDFNDTFADFVKDKTLTQLFEQRAEEHPGAIALLFGEKKITYGVLNEQSNQLAHYLKNKYKIGPGDRLAIRLERGPWIVVTALAVLKAGGAYVPIDTEYPQERIEYMLEDSQSKALIDEAELEKFRQSQERYGKENPSPSFLQPSNLAYIIYTSGTTGKPKGVMVEHRSVVNLVQAQAKEFGVTSNDNILQFSNFAFDVSVEQMFLALTSGARLTLIDKETQADPEKLEAVIEVQGVSHIDMVPGMLELLKAKKYSSLKWVISGGDRCSREVAERWSRYHTFYNSYGPTETTVTAMELRYEDRHRSRPVLGIGRPLANYRAYILDDRLNLQPIGVAGEICIGGAGVARGYWNRPELTAEKFVNDPFVEGGRIYRTGDTGRWLEDGTIEFIGRKDEQVKIRGYRIELGEIENTLHAAEGVEASVVTAKTTPAGEKELVAYFVSDKDIDVQELRARMGRSLPAYMIPAHFVRLNELPHTPNGKVDRKRLPDPEGLGLSGIEYVAPRNGTEEKLAAIWQNILGKEKIGVKDDFFQLGGHSLKASRLANQVQRTFEVKLSLSAFFENPALEQQARLIGQSVKTSYTAIQKAPHREYYPLSSAQKRLFFLQEFAAESTGYNMPMVSYLGKEAGPLRIASVLRQLIARHESLRTGFERIDKAVVQRIHSDVLFELDTHECSPEEFEDYVHSYIRPFDLAKAPLLRSALVHVKGVGYAWIVDLHHIISDGTSHQVLADDFMRLYRGEELPELRLQYRDFSEWQNGMRQSGELQKQKEYWLSQFAGSVPRLNLPADRPRPSSFNFEGALYNFTIPSKLTEAVRAFCRKNQSTLQMTLLSVLDVLLHKYTGQDDLVIGHGIAGRRHADLEHIVGMFVNTLAIRSFPEEDKSFQSFHKEVAAACLAAYDNQDIQFEDLVDMLQLERDPSRNPLFDITLVVQNFAGSKEDASGLINPDSLPGALQVESHVTSKFDMTWFVEEKTEDILVRLEYYSAIYDHATIERFSAHFLHILETVLENPALLIAEVSLLDAAGEKDLLHNYASANGSDEPEAIHDFFQKAAKLYPDNVALEDAAGSLTYRELDERSAQLANFLMETGLKKEDRVAILQSRSNGNIVSILGILKAGGAYVPLDSSYPEERLLYMLEDSGASVLLADKSLIELANRLQWRSKELKQLVCIDSHNIYSERGGQSNDQERKELWEHIGDAATDAISAGGWVSSYTGEQISDEEMKEFSENAYLKLKPYLRQDMKVLEIGCASGLTLFQVAPHVGAYHATDLSSSILKGTGKAVAEKGLANVTLSCLSAHDIDSIDDKDFDLVIINSVIQNFDGHNYLRDVLVKIIAKMKDSGLLFIGDIMDEERRQALLDDLNAFREANAGKGYRTKTGYSSELFLSRDYLDDLVAEGIGVASAEYSNKIFTIPNELTDFRFDALLKIDKQQSKPAQKKKQQYDLGHIAACGTNAHNKVKSEQLSYIIYTSGSTGRPKGVMVEHRSVVNLVLSQVKEFGITPEENILQFSNLAFDASVEQVFIALTSGARLTIIDKETQMAPERLEELMEDKGITHIHMVPAMLELIEARKYPRLKRVIAGGDRCSKELAEKWSQYHAFYNEYGPTETTITSIELKYEGAHRQRPVLGIGRPVANTFVYIVDNRLRLQPVGVIGEICIGGEGLARGYWNHPGLTEEKFIADPFRKGERMYRTGDMGRLLDDGSIEFIGRKDDQVKLRGHRIELGEIEHALAEHPAIDSCAVITKADRKGEQELIAYITGDQQPGETELRTWLGRSLPGYMIPSHYVHLDALPLNANGKVNRKVLPDPEGLGLSGNAEYLAPRNEVEQKLAAIWSEILGKEIIGVKDDFFELGGHSLRASRLANQVHRAFEVKLPLNTFFEYPTLEGQAGLIEQGIRTAYLAIEKAPQQEYYSLSSAQKRLFFLQEFAPQSTGYNMPMVNYLGEKVAPDHIAAVLRQLITRHESLRTSFEKVDGVAMQKIHAEVSFEMDRHECAPEEFADYFHSYIRPFDLTKAPLLRSSLVHVTGVGYAWIVDLHHIISDGTSHQVLADDFLRLYRGQKLPMLRLQYRDFSHWQNGLQESGELQKQKEYWLSQFTGTIPRLSLPADRPRPATFSFEGAMHGFVLDKELTAQVRTFCRKTHGTLQMVLVSALNVLFHRYTGQQDITIGCGIAGRRHPDLERIVGMFVNTLAIRNYPEGEKTFEQFYKEVSAACLAAYENQDLQFEDLVDMLQVERTPSANPVFDVALAVQNFTRFQEDKSVLLKENDKANALFHKEDHRTSKFDMSWFVIEQEDDIYIDIEYYTAIFDASSIERMVRHFTNVLRSAINAPATLLAQMDLLSGDEQQSLLQQFVEGGQPEFASEGSLHELFEKQSLLTPDSVAVISGDASTTYKDISGQSNQLAHFLINIGLKKGDPVGVLQSRNKDLLVSLLAILKAGGVYIPLDSDYPEDRLLYMLQDTGAQFLLTGSHLIELGNRLQWREQGIKNLVCIDSYDMYYERGMLRNELMRKDLWDHVGETATDAITAGGWMSSYTGDYLSAEEMQEYSENAFLKLKPYLRKDMKVLEIGCSSGLTMFQVALHVGAYHGTDLSSSILEGTAKEVAAKGYEHIALTCLPAHNIHLLDDEGFDLVIINSVIQSFDGHNYLRDVLVKVLDKMKDTGLLFIGDIMDEERRQALIDDLNAFAEANEGKGYRTKTSVSDELFISREYLDNLIADGIGLISGAYTDKICTIPNELTEFRFDALLQVNKRQSTQKEKTKHQYDRTQIERQTTEPVNIKPDNSDTAYVIYTSGSTGKPKGVMVTHGNLRHHLNHVAHLQAGNDRIVQPFIASASFDISIFQLAHPLLHGGTALMLDREDIQDMTRFAAQLRKVTVIDTVPAVYSLLANHIEEQKTIKEYNHITDLFIGGDAIPDGLLYRLSQVFRNASIHVTYGPTEATVFCVQLDYEPGTLSPGANGSVLGRPIKGSSIYITDEAGSLAPIGVTGEICIGGPGVAKGYLNRPELTEEKFVKNPFREGATFYKTGDLGRWLPDGQIEFIGRKDNQVKIRGYRIELGEIENVLRKHSSVQEAVVLKTTREGDAGLVAFVVGNGAITSASLRTYLGKSLPAYMVPAHFVQLEALPLTANGKVDRKKLPDPHAMGMASGIAYVAPRTATEEKLAQVWQELLGKEKIGAKDNFFESGGHSLKATRLTNHIQKIFEVSIELKELFLHPVLEDVARLIDEAAATSFAGIPVLAEQENYVLSSSQRRLWVLSQFEEANIAYNMPEVYVFEGTLNKQALEASFNALIERHESLRTVFRENEEGEVRQFINPAAASGFTLLHRDLRQEPRREQLAEELVKNDFIKPFDLSSGPLLRASLYQVEENKWVFTYVIHHIISDGWSMGVFLKELLSFYDAFSKGEQPELQPMRIQYKDYAAWQQQQLNGGNLHTHKDYWLSQFGGELPVLELPLDKPRPAVKAYNGATINKTIDAELSKALQGLTRRHDATLFMGLLAAVNTLLYRYTGQKDIIIGSPIAGRGHADLEEGIGFYLNTLALRAQFSGNDSYEQLLSGIRNSTLKAYEHQAYPFDELVDRLDLQRDLSRNALFDVMVILQNAVDEETWSARSVEGVSVSAYPSAENSASKFDLLFSFAETSQGIALSLQYNTDLFHHSSIERLTHHLEYLLRAIIKTPAQSLSRLDYLPKAEEEQLLAFNDTAADYPRDKTINALFEEQVEKTPEAIALVFENEQFTWRQLNEEANRLAHYLRAKYAIRPDDRLAISLERSPRMIVSLLAVLKSGGAYVPIDPQHPQERIDYMLEDSRSKALINEEEWEKFRSEGDRYSTGNPSAINRSTDLMYVMYTSGSTGKPKGCMLEHRGLVNRIEWMWKEYGFTSSDVILQKTTFTFDVSVGELFMPLCWGARMVLCHRDDVSSPERLVSLIQKEKATYLHFVPGMMQAFISWVSSNGERESLHSLRTVIASGEALGAETVRSWYELSGTPLYNLYGPTEASIEVSHYKTKKEDRIIPIGAPISNVQLYILDEHQKLQPLGVAGEICIGGEGLARGYWNRGELTAEKFVANPFRKGERIYRTGDLGRWLENGMIEYLGRKDEQVKVRGFRIELGEIGSALQTHPSVSSCVVIAKMIGQEKELIAYVTGEDALNAAELRAWLGRTLPHYMIPSHYVQLEAFPLTTSGKIDRKRLPDPEGLGLGAGVEYIAPRNEVEEKLAAIWSEILGREKISVKDNFFDLGGHSLKATRLASRIHKAFDVKLVLKDLFTAAVLEEQASLIRQSNRNDFEDIALVAEAADYPLSSSQRRVWVLSRLQEANTAYNMPGVYVFEGRPDAQALQQALYVLAERHEILRTVFRENEKGEPRQLVLPAEAAELRMELADLRAGKDRWHTLKALLEKQFSAPFDLSSGPLLKACLTRIEDAKWVFSYVMHHIISDGWSMNILMKELLQFYDAYAKGERAAAAPLRIQYKDYAAWQQQQLDNEKLQTHKEYWLKQFEGELPVLELPSDKPRPAVKTYDGAAVHLRLDAGLSKGLKALSQSEGGTLFMGILAAVNALLYRYTGQEDIIIGSPIAGREHADLEGQIGFYLNTLALRTRFSGAQSFEQLLREVKQVTLNAYHHQAYPFDELVEALHLRRDTSRSALFDVMVILQNNESDGSDVLQSIDSFSVSGYEDSEITVSKFDLEFNFTEIGEELHLVLAYNKDIYSSSSIERMGEHLQQLLAGIIGKPQAPVHQLDYLDAEEKLRLVSSFNNTSADYPRDKTIVELFAEQAEKTPERTALLFEDVELSYRELHERSSQLANYLKENHDIQPDDFVGIMLDRSDKTIVAILGVLKSGAAYVPIDVDYPDARKEFIVKDTGIKALITQSEYIFDIGYFDGGVFAIDLQLDSLETSREMPVLSITPANLAYVMYTSGSTGNPKGVMVEHRSAVRLVKNTNFVNLIGEEVILSAGAVSFDATTFEYWAVLLNGGKLVMSRKETLLDSSLLQEEIHSRKVDTMFFTTGWVNQLIDEQIGVFSGLKTLLTGGERISIPHIKKLHEHYPSLNIVHCYGPTENTTFSLTYPITSIQDSIPIGSAINNSTAYILDAQHRPVAVGVAGEICVGGDGLARGYLNNPELTAEKFIIADLPVIGKTRLYKTGDLGKWTADGNIEFMGRRDAQVKIRGFRIELGEIESVLQEHPAVVSAVVIARASGSEKELVAYAVGNKELDVADLTSWLGGLLPSYMIPAHFVQLDELPLNANGKVDRKKLPDPSTGSVLSGVEYIAPRNGVEERLAAIWQDILGKERISVKDNFFDLGGHSLKVTRLAGQIHKEFNVKPELKDLFEITVLEDQAKLIGQAAGLSYAAIERTEEQEDYPLSSSQRRLWVLSQFEEANIAYNMPGVIVFEGSLDRAALSTAFSLLIERHESLRTVFSENENGEVRQVIQQPGNTGFALRYLDLRNEADKDATVQELVQKDIMEPFDLSAGPLLRASLYQTDNDKWVFSYIMHHIISDGWSMNILVRELLQFYGAEVKGESASLAPLRIQYKDYTAWQQEQLEGEKLQAQKNYWLKQFEGELPVLELSSARPRPAVKTYNGGIVHLEIEPELKQSLKAICGQEGGTLFMGLIAAVNALLYRYTGGEDIIIGSPIAGREHPDLEGQIGFYLNTLALRSRFSGKDSFRQLLEEVKRTTLEAYQHQLYPFDELVEALDLRRDMSRSALFDVMVVLQNNESDGSKALMNIDNLSVSGYEDSGFPISKFDLVFEFFEMGESLHLALTYNSDIYEEESIGEMSRHLHDLLSTLLRQPGTPVDELDYLGEEEKHQLLAQLDNTSVTYPNDKTIVQLFEEQAVLTPQNIAVAFEEKELSYKELNEQSNRLAHFIRSNHTIHPDDLIAVQLERSEKMIVALLAVLKSGGAYVPIDPGYPQERIDYMISDSGCKLVIDEELLKKFYDEEEKYGVENPSTLHLSPSSLAYVIYTSGTTGKPKGSLIEHRNVVRLFKTDKPLFDFTDKDVWTVFHSFCFDFSVWEMYGALLFGGKTVVVSKALAQDTAAYRELLLQHKVTVLNQTPSAFYNLTREELESTTPNLQLRYVIFGGEALSPGRLNEWKEKYPSTKLVNMYGITETTVHVTYKEITEKEIEQNISNIGSPIPTLGCYVLDAQQNLLPAGVWGELYVGGEGVCRGYLNKPELTAQRFISHPFKSGERLYRSGDRVRLLQSGELEYGGRMDEQVKIRGYRIELGEIESVLQNHTGIESALVMARTGSDGEKELVAYVVGNGSVDTAGLRKHTGATLPAYMIPAHFVQLEELPLTANGKVDRKKLPQPEAGLEAGAEYLSPRNATEEKLVSIWQSILGVEKISVKDNFFELGGHSLRATRLASQVRKELNVRVPLAELFAHPVLEDMALWIQRATRSEEARILPVAEQASYPLSSAQRRLWVLSRFEEANAAYNMPGVYIFEGELDTDAFATAFQLLIDRHEALRTVFKKDEEGNIRQFIRSSRASGFTLEQQDLRHTGDREQKIKELVAKEIAQPFDLASGPLLRAALYRAEQNKWVFVYVMHHIISDGWSMGLLVNELLTLYNAYAKGESYPLPPLAIQYKDYASWQQQQLNDHVFNIHKEYWLARFAELPPVLELPADKPRPAIKTYNGHTLHWTIPSEISKGLQALNGEQGATLFMGLMAVVNTLLHRYSNAEDIVLGTPIAGRDRHELEDGIGFYLNTLPLRTRFSSNDSYKELLAKVKKVTLDAYEHQSYPFDELVDALPLQRSMSRSPLFDVMVVLQNNEQSATKHADRLSIDAYPDMENPVSKFDLVFNFVEVNGALHASLEYNTDLYEGATAQRMAGHLQQLMAAVIAQPSQSIALLDYLSEEEKEQVLFSFNDTATDYPRGKTIADLFEKQVERTPEAIILVSGEDRITYRQLNENVNKFAYYLKNKYSIQPGELVAICLERGPALITSILAVIKAGGAYVPIDPLYPQERIDYMLEDSRSKVLINHEELAIFRSEENNCDSNNPSAFSPQPSHLAYVIYTSGSTGKPKGVMVQHQSLINLCFWYKGKFRVRAEDRTTLYAGVAFDASVFELFPYIISGATLYFIPEEIRLDVYRLSEFYEANGITIAFLPTQMAEQFIMSAPEPSSLRCLLLGGDKMNFFTKRSYMVDNSYGPTENTIVVTSGFITQPSHNIPIGTPIDNAQVYILDSHLNPQPVGVPGEICISGESLSLGYWNRPDLTAEKFVGHPFRTGERMYHTGDLGRWLPDGSIEFLGRRDSQVKVRGYRIEPGEIEAALHNHPSLSSCIVAVKVNRQGEKELVAYLAADEKLNAGELRSWLGKSLPAHLIPSHFVQMEALPLTPNGKVDRKALPDPEGLSLSTGNAYVAPRNGTEKSLVAIWQEVLGSDRIGVNDNFFDLGGNSFKIVRMVEAVNAAFGKSLAVVIGFKYPNITELAAFLLSEEKNDHVSDEDIESDINTLDETLQILNTE